MEEDEREIAFSTTDYKDRSVIAYESTLEAHRIKHQEPFTNEDIIECLEDPDLVARTGHDELSHKRRLLYYRRKRWEDNGPDMMKTIVEHKSEPGVVTSSFRTSRVSKDGTIEYISQRYIDGAKGK